MKIWGRKGEKCQRRIHELLQGGEVMKVEALSPLEESWPGHQGTACGGERWQGGTLAGEVLPRGPDLGPY